MPGPPKAPVEKKRRLGNPSKERLPDRSRVIALPSLPNDKPDSLGPDGSQFWDDVIKSAGAWLGVSDYVLLRLTAEAMDRRAFMLRQLAEDGWSIVTDKGYPYKHPLVGAVLDVEREIVKWLSLLGMTPSDRARLGLAEVKAQSKLEELRQRQAKR